MIRILFLGEIVSRAGIASLKKELSTLKKELSIDYVVANGEGTTGGFGLGKAHAIQLSKIGVDLITGGEKLFYKVDMVDFIGKTGFVLRPLNYPTGAPGRGIKLADINGNSILFINLIGSSGFSRISVNNPFSAIDGLLKKNTQENTTIVQFHASTTAEEATMLHMLDGKVAAVIGTHNKALSADARVTENGTAFISDNGRVGSFLSVGGLEPETEIKKLRTLIPIRSKDAWEDCRIQGVVVDIDPETRKSTAIMTINREVEVSEKKDEAERYSN